MTGLDLFAFPDVYLCAEEDAVHHCLGLLDGAPVMIHYLEPLVEGSRFKWRGIIYRCTLSGSGWICESEAS